ncbi:hypothetical protein GH714_008898 [Hevea brasiliensis]|uniref:Peptidase A1 domain-containing protein n=1 Tax=Hevea brasiliensis TaxID=3981 RepID=A0A6A6MM27_HEVBR|nr:hypothetical protein GH714_008898 [Hevea brasiliensis]
MGFFATEKLTISSSDVFNNFLFGCGQENDGLLGKSAGLLGLGRSKLSLAFQTASKYKKLFSYCIPTLLSSTGHLSFGGKLPKSVKFTPLSPKFKNTPFYGIDITGISVGGRKLSVNASFFTKAGAIIDSGGVEIGVELQGIMIAVKGLEKVCLAFASTSDDSDIAILGNAQQKSYEVVHDLAKGRIGFAPGGCS